MTITRKLAMSIIGALFAIAGAFAISSTATLADSPWDAPGIDTLADSPWDAPGIDTLTDSPWDAPGTDTLTDSPWD